ncbi:MAG TPA: chemotaxis protein CheC [Terriglobia bacterium]|nr:chemotaxis protein CheC [Terriglobia bacterium]
MSTQSKSVAIIASVQQPSWRLHEIEKTETHQARGIAGRHELRSPGASRMMGLTERQTDALKELVNIAFGLTASKLSEISSRRVVLEVPVVAIHPMVDLARELGGITFLCPTKDEDLEGILGQAPRTPNSVFSSWGLEVPDPELLPFPKLRARPETYKSSIP